MDNTKLMRERIDLYKTTVKKEKEPSRILNQACVFNWRYIDAGYNLNDVLCDYDKMYDANVRFMTLYNHDFYPELGWRNPLKVTRSVGNNLWEVNAAGDELSIRDHSFMEWEDYDALIKDPMKYLWETFNPRKNTKIRGTKSGETILDGLKEYKALGEYLVRISETARRDFGVPNYSSKDAMFTSYDAGHELLFNILRGMKNIAIDVRKDSAKVKAAIESIEQTFVDPFYEELYKRENGTDMNCGADQSTVMLSHSILNPKQFEVFYWPFLKKLADYAESKDKIIEIYLESDSERFWDLFRDLPKGHFIFNTELDDMYKMKKELPNIALIGGMPVYLLGNGTPQQCINKVKELIDTLAPGGGYMLSPNKTLAYRNDARPENLKAICDYMAAQKSEVSYE